MNEKKKLLYPIQKKEKKEEKIIQMLNRRNKDTRQSPCLDIHRPFSLVLHSLHKTKIRNQVTFLFFLDDISSALHSNSPPGASGTRETEPTTDRSSFSSEVTKLRISSQAVSLRPRPSCRKKKDASYKMTSSLCHAQLLFLFFVLFLLMLERKYKCCP